MQTFPDIEEMYKQRTLSRLLDKEQWEVAAAYAGQDKQCQVRLVLYNQSSFVACKHLKASICTAKVFQEEQGGCCIDQTQLLLNHSS